MLMIIVVSSRWNHKLGDTYGSYNVTCHHKALVTKY
jgi:hypothetical protein